MRQAAARRDHTLTWHLAALEIVVAVPLLALAIIPTSIYVASERVRLESVAKVAREDVLSLIDRDLSAKTAILRALATSPALDAGDFDRFDSQARELIGFERFNIVLRDRTGRQLVNTIVPKGTPLPERPKSGSRSNSHRFETAVYFQSVLRPGLQGARHGRDCSGHSRRRGCLHDDGGSVVGLP